MPPAPARIARTPRQNGRKSWNPAVPPPPVPGGAAGKELADGLGAGGLGLRLVALGVALLGVALLGVLREVAALEVRLAGAVGAARPVPPGESDGGVVDGEPPPVQADTDAVTSTAKAAQLRTVPRKRHRP